MKKTYNFYLTNYKAIHHSITIMMMVGFMIFVNKFIVELPLWGKGFESLAFDLILLYINYKITVFTLKKSGLDDHIKKEIEQTKKSENVK